MFAVNFNKITMPVFYGVALIDNLKSITSINSTIGFVPTMGALHDGFSSHATIIGRNDTTVVSIC
jgi:pantoate--beta-alanine ligase